MRRIKHEDLTYANVDGPDDKWFWAIVRYYREAQSYGEIVCAFEAGHEPTDEKALQMMKGLTEL